MDPLLSSFGINLLSSAAYEVFTSALREHVMSDDASFAKRVRDTIARRQMIELDRKVVRQTLFRPDVWVAVLSGDPSPSSWIVLLHDLTGPALPPASEIAQALVESVRINASAAMTESIRSLTTIAELAQGQVELKEGQASIYAEIKRLQARYEEQIAREPAQVDSSIVKYYRSLGVIIEELTAEQLRVIRYLHGVRRALVPGSAGSGKTLVATEKAVRLDHSGLRTLLLCHNPFLASRLQQMTEGSSVEVADFGTWVAGLSGAPTNQPWTKHAEPLADELDKALSVLLQSGRRWDAVIVDEGQDFREDWWLLLEAAVGDHGVIYIFADDDQRLTTFRQYLEIDQLFDMSRNCRNSGAVYAYMRRLVGGLSNPDPRLAQHGSVVQVRGDGDLEADLQRASIALGLPRAGQSTFIVAMEGRRREILSCDPLPTTPIGLPWRQGLIAGLMELLIEAARVDHRLPRRARNEYSAVYSLTAEDSARLYEILESGLSHAPFPTNADITLVHGVVAQVVREMSFQAVHYRAPAWRDGAIGLRLVRDQLGTDVASAAEFFASGSWLTALPKPTYARLKSVEANERAGSPPDDHLIYHVYEVPQVKGLEADRVILVLDSTYPMSLTEHFVAASRARDQLVVLHRWPRRPGSHDRQRPDSLQREIAFSGAGQPRGACAGPLASNRERRSFAHSSPPETS